MHRISLLSIALVAVVASVTAVPLAVARQSAPPPAPAKDAPSAETGGQTGGQQDGAQGGGRRGGGMGGMGRMFGGGGGGGGGGGPGGGGLRDMREQFDADFLRRDVPIFREQLKLDEGQTLILETLIKDYEDEYTKASGEAQTKMTELAQSMFANIVTPQMRERFQSQMQNIQQELQQLAQEKGGEIDEETRRAFFRDRMQKMQAEAMEERKAAGADTEMKKTLGEMFDKMSTWMTQKEAMRTKFVDSLKAGLNDEQLAHWPAFDRFLTREKTLPKGRLAGESTNMFLVIDELKMPETELAKVIKNLDDYELRLDAALKSRNEYLGSSMAKLFKAMQDGDAKDGTRIMDRQVELRTAVRDVNDEFRTTIVGSMGDSEWAKKFETASLKEGYERVYRPTTTERSFDKALELTDLGEAVRTSVIELQRGYLAELGMKNSEILAATRKNEPPQLAAESGRFVTMMAGAMNGDISGFGPGGGGDRGPDPVREQYDVRNKMSDGYLDRLKALLTPEQVAELPKRESRGGGGGISRMLDSMPQAQRDDIMKRFDKNKDGQLDDSEQGEAFRSMREEFGGGRGGPGAGGGGGGGGGRGGA